MYARCYKKTQKSCPISQTCRGESKSDCEGLMMEFDDRFAARENQSKIHFESPIKPELSWTFACIIFEVLLLYNSNAMLSFIHFAAHGDVVRQSKTSSAQRTSITAIISQSCALVLWTSAMWGDFSGVVVSLLPSHLWLLQAKHKREIDNRTRAQLEFPTRAFRGDFFLTFFGY